jgi:predicted enzyme related to lactoylglutathione lyase
MSSHHGRFAWYELMTTDVEAAKAFYGKVVGWGTREAPNSRYTLFTAGQDSASGLINLPPDAKQRGARPQWVGYISVDDVDDAVTRLKELGGTVYIPPTDAGDISRFSVVADPQMATFVLVQWRDPGRQLPIDPRAMGHVGWHELFAIDWERAFAFYREIFGWQKVVADVGPAGTYQQFSAAGQAAAERVRAERGTILEGPTDIPGGGRVVRCADPQGAMFALIGKQRDKEKAVGYFERDASPGSSPRA